MADDDYEDFLPANPELDVAQIGAGDYAEFIPEFSGLDPNAKRTHYGYPGDSTPDYNSSHWIGDRSNTLSADPQHHSVALTRPERGALFGTWGKSTGQLVGRENNVNYYDEDTAPERDRRIDVFDPQSRAIDYRPGRRGRSQNDYSGFIPEGQQPAPRAEPADDYSGFIPEGQQPAPRAEPADDYSGFKPASEAVAPADQQAPVASLWNQILDVWKLGRANAKTAIPAQAANAPALPDDIDTEIQNVQASAYLSQEQKDQTIATLRGQQAQERGNQAKELPQAQADQAKAQEQFNKDKPGPVAQFIGGTANYVPYAAGGPIAPLLAAQQATSETYGEVLTQQLQKAKQAHPEWSDAEAMQHALQAAQDAGRGAGGAMLALSWLDIPAAGPLLKRMVQKAGSSALTMEIANMAAQIQKNMAIQKNVDPKQQWYDGLNDIEFHLSNLAGGAAFGAVHEATSMRPNTEKPGVVNVPVTPEGQTGRPQRPIPAPPIQQAQQQEEPQPGTKAAPVEENGEAATVEPNEEASRTTEPVTQTTPSGSETQPGGVRGVQNEPGTEKPTQGVGAAEERRPADQLSDSDRQQIVGRVRNSLGVALNKFRPLFEALGVPIEENSRHGALVTPTQNGSVAGFNAARLADGLYRDWVDGGTHYADQGLINDTVAHEFIHAAWIDAQRRRWLADGQQQPWLTFHYTEASGIDEAIQNAAREARRTGDDELYRVLTKGYESGLKMYTYGEDTERLSPAQRAAEIVRQLVQLKTSDRITEDFNQGVFRNLLGHIQNFYETARSRLVELYNRVKNNSSGVKELQLAVKETSQRLAEIGYLKESGQTANEYRASQRPEEYTPGKKGNISYHGPGTFLEKTLLPNREVVEKAPHTQEVIRALDEMRAREGELHGKVADLNHLFKQLIKRNPGLDKEIDQIGRYAEQNRVLPAKMSNEARTWLKAANNGLYREIGDRMRAGGFKTLMPDGSTRPFVGAPPGALPLPRTMRPDVQKVLEGRMEDGNGNFTKEAQKIYNEGVAAGFFKTPDDFKEWARQYRMDQSSSPAMTNLERARTTKYPTFFYSYSPQAMLDRLFHQATELSRLETFGQKLPGQTDAIDRALEKINADMTLTKDRKQHAVEALGALRNTVYGLNRRSAAVRLMRGLSSAGLAGSPHTSAKIGLGMLFNLPQYRGLGRTLQGIFETTVQFPKVMTELRRMGLSQDTLLNLHDDPYSVQTAERRASNIFTGILKVAGHAIVQDIGKAVTMRVSRAWLERAIEVLKSDPNLKSSLAKQIAQDIERRGVDPKQFMTGQVSQELKDRFVREDVNDLQTAYRPEDYPAWQATGMGSMMFQFGHWAYNGSRAIVREAVIPMVKAFNQGDALLGTRYFARLAGLGLAAGGAAEAWRQLDQLFGRQPAVATIGEIMQSFVRNNPEAAHMLIARIIEDMLTSPVLGMFGDIANLGRNTTRGAAGETHFFNPASPAAVGYVNIIGGWVNTAFQQGGHLSNRQKVNMASQLVELAKGYYDMGVTASQVAGKLPNVKIAGVPVPGQAEALGRRENSFVKSRLDLFYQMHPESDKRSKGGTFPGNTHTPYLQDLNEALLAGNVSDARTIAANMKKDLKLTPDQLKTSLRESINAHRPVPTGSVGTAFSRWAGRTMPPDEMHRMRTIERVYERTAERAGLPVKETE